MTTDWDGAERREPPPERRCHVTPDHLRDVLAALMQHMEEEDSVRRSVDELRGVVGSISGELGQMKELVMGAQADMVALRKGLSDLEQTTRILGKQIGIHIEQAQPVMEVSEAFMVLARAGGMIWRLKWAIIAAVLMIWALLRGDVPAMVKAFGLLFGHHP